MASEAGVTDVVDVLMANGASTSITTAQGDTAAYLAAYERRWQVLRKLQDYGVVLDGVVLGILRAHYADYVAEGVSDSKLEDIMESAGMMGSRAAEAAEAADRAKYQQWLLQHAERRNREAQQQPQTGGVALTPWGEAFDEESEAE